MSALLPVKCGGRGLNAYPYFRCLSQEAKRLSIGCGLYSDHAMVEKILDYAEWVQGERTSSPPGPARCKSKNHERMTPIPPNQPACMHALRCRPSPQAEELVPSSPSLHSLEYPVPRPLPPDWPTPWTTYYLQDVVLGAPISLHIARSISTPSSPPTLRLAGTLDYLQDTVLGEPIAKEAVAMARTFYGAVTPHPVTALCLTAQVCAGQGGGD